MYYPQPPWGPLSRATPLSSIDHALLLALLHWVWFSLGWYLQPPLQGPPNHPPPHPPLTLPPPHTQTHTHTHTHTSLPPPHTHTPGQRLLRLLECGVVQPGPARALQLVAPGGGGRRGEHQAAAGRGGGAQAAEQRVAGCGCV